MADSAGGDYRGLMKDALLELQRMRSRIEALERTQCEPVAVIGIGCRFPGGGNSPEEFWRLLRNGVDAIVEIPPERWSLDAFYDPDVDAPGKVYCRSAGLVDQKVVEEFSPAFFGIAPREAERMDPQQRVLLEVCWEAIEDAAVPADALRGSQTGLFVGSCTDDYLHLTNHLADPAGIDGYSSLGTARSITVGRVSYVLGLEGPAVQLDTACSSSLVTVHQACASLRSKECDLALAGGVNLQLSPVWTVGLSKLKALSPDGRCRAFDARANGFGRGEGCGIVVLRRLSDAVAAGDRILAVIRGSAVNHDGRSGGLTVPSQFAQEKLLRRALESARLGPDEIDYIEAHGTGTSLGDPIELRAIGNVFAPRSGPLWVGSVKTNVGHLEGAAGIVGLMKVILALRHDEIPPNLHFDAPNPLIPWDELPVRVPTRPVPWPQGPRCRRAGVSSFGFSGTNAHAIVEEAPAREEQPRPERPVYLLLISAKTPEALRDLAARYAARLREEDAPPWSDVCFTAAVGRSHFQHRAAVLAATGVDASERLEALVRGTQPDGVFCGTAGPQRAGGPSRFSFDEIVDEKGDVLGSLARQYVAGHPIDWAAYDRAFPGRKVSLPTYPFQRQRYWRDRGAECQPAVEGGRLATCPTSTAHPLLGERVFSAAAPDLIQFESLLAADRPALLAEHRLGEMVVVPATALVEMALAAASTEGGGTDRQSAQDGLPNRPTDSGLVLEDVAFEHAIALVPGRPRVVQTVLVYGQSGGRLEIFSRPASPPESGHDPLWTRQVSARVAWAPRGVLPAESLDDLRGRFAEEVSVETVYGQLARQGLSYGKTFRALRQVWRGRGESLGYVALDSDGEADRPPYTLHPALFDASLHAIAALAEADSPQTLVPVGLERLELYTAPGTRLWSHVRLRETNPVDRQTGFSVDVDLIDPDGSMVVRIQGLRLRAVERLLLPDDEAPRGGSDEPARPATPQALRLREAPAGTRRRILVEHVRGEVAAVLECRSPQEVAVRQNFFDLGMDSLTSVELRHRLERSLGCRLPLTVAMDYPTVEALADVLYRELHLEEKPSPRASRPSDDGEPADRLAGLTDEEVESLLAKKLREIS